MARKVGKNKSGDRSMLPDNTWYPCIFKGEKELKNGAAVAVFDVMLDKNNNGILTPAGFSVDLFLTEKDDNDSYKESIIGQLFRAWGNDNPPSEGEPVIFPSFDNKENVPVQMQVPVALFLKRDSGNYLSPWGDNYQWVKPWSQPTPNGGGGAGSGGSNW